MKLTILIPAIPERLSKAKRLFDKLNAQIEKLYPCEKHTRDREVQILSLCDNLSMSIGQKRNDLKGLTRGEYFAFCDDDDNVSKDYIDEILKAIEQEPDIITFKQRATLNNKSFIVNFGLEYSNETVAMKDGEYMDINRSPFHVCIWKTALVKNIKFPYINYGEDWKWAKKALRKVKKEIHIDKVLHHYKWDENKTRAY